VSSLFVLILEVVLIALGFNITYDVAVLFHGYDIAGNTAQIAANAGAAQVSSINAIKGADNYVGQYAVQQAELEFQGKRNVTGSCSDISNNAAIACTVTYDVSLPTVFGKAIRVSVKQTIASKPVAIGYGSHYSPTS